MAELCGTCISVRLPSGSAPAASPAFPGCWSQTLFPHLSLRNASAQQPEPTAPRMARHLTFRTEALATMDPRAREATGVVARTARVARATSRGGPQVGALPSKRQDPLPPPLDRPLRTLLFQQVVLVLQNLGLKKPKASPVPFLFCSHVQASTEF